MLKKLLKYDWKSFWKVPATINLFLIIITVIGVTSFVSPFWKQEGDLIEVLAATALLFYILSIMAGSIGITVYTAIRYYKSLYTDEGYLTNTLPVRPGKVVLSKLLIASVWELITNVVVVVSMFVLMIVAFSSYEDVNIVKEFLSVYEEASRMFAQEAGISLTGFIIWMAVYCVIGTVFSVLMIYSAIALGQLFTTHKVMGAVIWYIAEYIIIQTGVSLLVNLPLGITMFKGPPSSPSVYLTPFLVGSFIMTLVLSVILFFISQYLLKKRLNLD